MSKRGIMSPIVNFYISSGTDLQGRSLSDMLAMTDEQLERTHDVVQWAFPLNEESKHNRNAPVLTEADITALASPQGRYQYIQAVDRFLAFYGMEKVRKDNDPELEVVSIVPSIDFDKQAQWLTAGNHNLKRITRIIRCAILLGRQDVAEILRDGFSHLAEHPLGQKALDKSTLQYWNDAVSLPFDQKLNVSPLVRKIFRT